MMQSPLPEFNKPPVTEVVLGIQFERLDSLQSPQLGSIWHLYRDRFPKTEEQPPLEPAVEQFGARTGRRQGVRLMFSPMAPRPRLWFLNEEGTELVQVQQDRFVRNWRKRDDAQEYPRYHILREAFREDFASFRRLVESEQWGAIEPNQCEVTYVNVIPAGEGWQDHGELDKLLTVFTRKYSDDGLGTPEEAAVNLQFVLSEDNEPVGRLHVAANPVYHVPTNQPAIRLTLTARGKPDGEGVDGIMQFLDRGHEEIVRGFTSITTPEMHKVWERAT